MGPWLVARCVEWEMAGGAFGDLGSWNSTLGPQMRPLTRFPVDLRPSARFGHKHADSGSFSLTLASLPQVVPVGRLSPGSLVQTLPRQVGRLPLPRLKNRYARVVSTTQGFGVIHEACQKGALSNSTVRKKTTSSDV